MSAARFAALPFAGGMAGIGWRHPHYAELLERRPQLDFVEVHSENFFGRGGAALNILDQGRASYAVSLHGVGLSLGSTRGPDPDHLAQLATLVRRIEPVRVSDHACFARGVVRGSVVHASDLLPIPFHSEALQVLCDNVQQTQEALGRPILVENLSSYIEWREPAQEAVWAETEFLNTLAQRSGCGLLVDVNNIYVNARNAALRDPTLDPFAACTRWLDAIAPEHVGELHLAGHCLVQDAHGEIVIDDHGSRVNAAVWGLYRHALERFGPVPTLIEWDTDIPSMDVLLDEASRARTVAAGVFQGIAA